MMAQVTWVVLHGSESHEESSGLLSFEPVLGGLVALLVVVGVLWYLGVFESLGDDETGETADGTEPETGVGD